MAQYGLFFGGFVFALWQQGNVKRTGPGQPSNFFLLQKIGQQTKGSIQAPGKGKDGQFVTVWQKQGETTILIPTLPYIFSFTFHSSLVTDGSKQGGTTNLSEPGGNATILYKERPYRKHREFHKVT